MAVAGVAALSQAVRRGRAGWRDPHGGFGREKHSSTAHTNKSSDECDIPTGRMLLEMCTNKGKPPTMHTDYQWQKYNPLSLFVFFLNLLSSSCVSSL